MRATAVCVHLLVILFAATAVAQYPTSWDWRDVDGVDYVSPPRNYGSCSCPNIFGPVAMVEARVRISVTRQGEALPSVDYSEQNILACGTGYFGDFDCNGGYAKDTLTHIRDHGVPDEDCHNYITADEACPTGCPDSAAEKVLHWPVEDAGEFMDFPDDATVMQEIFDNGPVAATMDIYEDLNSYSSGVYEHVTGNYLGSTVVLIVGWGVAGSPHWICRNSWGPSWGDGGDILVARTAQHADCEFGEWVWTCTIDDAAVDTEPVSLGGLKSLFR